MSIWFILVYFKVANDKVKTRVQICQNGLLFSQISKNYITVNKSSDNIIHVINCVVRLHRENIRVYN